MNGHVRVRMLWQRDAGSDDHPWLIQACDEYTEDAWNGIPDFYLDSQSQDPANTREVIVWVPQEAIHRAFATVEATAQSDDQGLAFPPYIPRAVDL